MKAHTFLRLVLFLFLASRLIDPEIRPGRADEKAVQQLTMEANCIGATHFSVFSEVMVRFQLTSTRMGIRGDATVEVIHPVSGPQVMAVEETRIQDPRPGFATAYFGGPRVEFNFACAPIASGASPRSAKLSVRQMTAVRNASVSVAPLQDGAHRLSSYTDLQTTLGAPPYLLIPEGKINWERAQADFGRGSENPYSLAVSRNISATAGPDEPITLEIAGDLVP